MDAADMIRGVRRRLGVSQRALALLVDCSPRSIAAWESGAHVPSLGLLNAVLAASGHDLVLVDRQTEQATSELCRHLHLSLTQRLRIALGEPVRLAVPTRTTVWTELVATSRRGQVVLEPPLATALWLPMGKVMPARVSVFHAKTALPQGALEVRPREGDAPRSLIPVQLDPLAGPARVWVLPPAELAQPSLEQSLLWQADQLLAVGAPRDTSQRRRPAHRDPNASQEDYRTLQSADAPYRPDMRNGRAWRLGAPASLAQQLLWR